MLSYGTPNDPSFAYPWVQTALFVFPFILFSAAEAFFLPSRQYKDATRLSLMAGGTLFLASSLIIAVLCLPSQVKVAWQMPQVRDLLIPYQVIFGSSALWMGFAAFIYRYLYIPWMPLALPKHIALFGVYTGIESLAALVTNNRQFDTTHLPLIVSLCDITLFYFWLRIPLTEFKQGNVPPPSSKGELETARKVVSELSRRIAKGPRNERT